MSDAFLTAQRRASLCLALATTAATVLLASCATVSGNAAAPKAGQWAYTGGDAHNSKYSPLTQINGDNVGKLKVQWTWDSPDNELAKTATRERPSYFKSTPLYVDGVLYTSTSLSEVAAVDPQTGATLWVYDPKAYTSGRRPANSGWQNRGVAYWSGDVAGKREGRVIIATGTGELIAVDAHTGKPSEGFGVNGRVDLQAALIRDEDDRKLVGFDSPPIVVGDVIVCGGVITDRPTWKGVPAGDIQAFDVRTGAPRWVFHTVPREGEAGIETWENDSARFGGASNAWGPLSADPELGIVYAATGTAANDFWGGQRPGNDLYAESLLAIKVSTGKLLWHFQAVHHGLWDYDFPAAPVLADITVNGKRIKAVAQVGKNGFTYVFDRVTGHPVWPIEERPVPQSTVPGEKAALTQPFPTKPPAFSRQGLTTDDLVDFTPELRAEALKVASDYVLTPLYTPPIVVGENGKKGILMAPSAGGGANWGGAGFDPELGLLFLDAANTYSLVAVGERKPPEGGAPQRVFELSSYSPIGPGVANGIPLTKPPYSSVVAIDLNAGDIRWRVPHGDGPRDHPALKALKLPQLGATRNLLSGSGPLITKTLLFMNQVQTQGMFYSGTGYFLRAFDKRTGKVVWEQQMQEPPNSIPMTYEHNGKQYIVVATGGAGVPAKLQAFALP